MCVFILNEKINHKAIITDDYKINETIGHCKIDLDFSSKKVFSNNYKLSNKTHTNDSVYGIVLPALFEIGNINYKGENFKVLISDYDFGDAFKNSKNIPGANPQYINGEFVILCLMYKFYVGAFVCTCIHELGHIITLRGTKFEGVLTDISKYGFNTKEEIYQAGIEEGLADAFMFAQIKDNKTLVKRRTTQNGYYFLFHGTDPKLEVYRKKIPHYKEYYKGYSSIIYTDIYSSPKVKRFIK